jgi:outer membrane protein OmpA-like peptidoglycan-associated protein
MTGIQLTGGFASAHPPAPHFPILAAPSSRGERNVIRQELVTVACWRLNDLRFDFDSAFLTPTAAPELAALRKTCEAHPDSPLSIFGHSDPSGDEDYNKVLSGRRAEAVYAVLTHDVPRWEKLFSHPHGGDEWGTKQLNTILHALGHKNTLAFQKANDLSPDGVAGPKTRAQLFLQYFQFLFPVPLPKSAFLGQGSDPDGKADFQGCGEFNPALILSASEQQTLSKADRDAANAANRRVLILFFRPGTVAPMDRWPCPRASENSAGCRRRFWSDAPVRRSPNSERRTFADSADTFGCRFYHRLAAASPCELSAARLLFVEIFIDLAESPDALIDEFQLVSADGEYNCTLTRTQAHQLNPQQVVLVFTNVIAGQSYSLYHYPAPDVLVPVFSNVPFDALNHNAAKRSHFRQVKIVRHIKEPQITIDCDDPVFDDLPLDFLPTRTRYADPHLSGAACCEV